jgi:hypothetical protein
VIEFWAIETVNVMKGCAVLSTQVLDMLIMSDWLSNIPPELVEGIIFVAASAQATALIGRVMAFAVERSLVVSALYARVSLQACIRGRGVDLCVTLPL